MARPRRGSNVSSESSMLGRSEQVRQSEPCYKLRSQRLQELGSMYDYLAKVILLGPSGSGKFVTSVKALAEH